MTHRAHSRRPASPVLDFRRLFDASPNPYLILDRALTIAGANRAYLATVKRELPDLVGRWAWEAFPTDPETERQAVASFERVIATKRTDVMALLRFDTPRPEGEGGGFDEHHWTIIHAPVLDEEGEVAFILQHPIEVTELKRLRDAADAAGPSPVPAQTGIFERARSVHEANLALKAESERLERMFRQAPSFMALLRGPDHVFELANAAFMRLIGHREVIGRPVRDALPDAARQGYVDLLDRVRASGDAFTSSGARYAVQAEPSGPVVERFVDFVYQPIMGAGGRVEGIFVDGSDVTERVEAEAVLRASEERRRLAMEAGEVGLWEIDLRAHTLHADDRVRALNGVLEGELDLARAMDAIHPEDRPKMERALGALTDGDGETLSRRCRIVGIEDGKVRHVQVNARSSRDASGAVTRLVGAARDVTEQVEAEAQRAVLTAELSHRLKNTLATVQALAAQTLRPVTERAAVDAFMQRLHALSAAHDVLVLQNWASARMRDVVKEALSAFVQAHRFTIGGPDIELGSKAALSLSLLLHELATNAIKHGALSGRDGFVAVSWRVEETEDGPVLVFDWREAGGPVVTAPTTRGFGSRLIGMGLMGTGGVELSYDTAGFAAEMRAPLSEMQHS